MRRDEVDKTIQRKGLATLLPVRRNMASVVYKRLKCQVLHVEKVRFWIPVNIS